MEINYYQRATEYLKWIITCKSMPLPKTRPEEYNIWRHLIELIGETEFNHLTSNLEDDFEQFHKMFRQTDITNNVHIDMIIWNFICLSEIPYYVHNFIQDKNHDGTPVEDEWKWSWDNKL